MRYTVKISYDEFLKIKATRYNIEMIKFIASRHIGCNIDDIDDVDWSFKRTFDVYLNCDSECYLEEDTKYVKSK